MPVIGPVNGNVCLPGWPAAGDAIILSTVPGKVVLGRSRIRAVSRFNSAIRADLAMRGLAISFVTLARVAVSDSVLALLCAMHPW